MWNVKQNNQHQTNKASMWRGKNIQTGLYLEPLLSILPFWPPLIFRKLLFLPYVPELPHFFFSEYNTCILFKCILSLFSVLYAFLGTVFCILDTPFLRILDTPQDPLLYTPLDLYNHPANTAHRLWRWPNLTLTLCQSVFLVAPLFNLIYNWINWSPLRSPAEHILAGKLPFPAVWWHSGVSS